MSGPNDPTPDPDPLEAILTEWFLAVGRGERPELEELCGGDAALAARARGLIETEPALLTEELGESVSGAGGEDLGNVAGYRLLEELGRGGMGVVYLAEEEALRRKVALKLLPMDRLRDDRARLRFRREAELAAALDHPNIVPIFAVGETDRASYIAMRRLSGPSLDRRPLPLDPREVAEIGAKLADALDAAHQAGIVHRDVKPSNVLLDAGEPILVDFGLARAHSDVTLTRESTVPGTMAYLAPECLQGDSSPLDPRMDVYGLGATLYELAVRKPPFLAERTAQLVADVVAKTAPPLGLGSAHRDLETVVIKALEKQPADRIPSAAVLRDELQRYLRGEPIQVRPTGTVTRLIRRARRNGKATAAIVVGLLLMLSAAGVATASWLTGREVFASSLGLAEDNLANGRYAEALEIVEQLGESHAGDADLADLAERARAEMALERVLDQMMNRRETMSGDDLSKSLDDLVELDGRGRRGALAKRAFAVGCWMMGRDEAARASLATLGESSELGPAGTALAEIVDGGGDRPDDHPGLSLAADDYLLAAVVARHSGEALEVQRRAVDLALAMPGTSLRSVYLRAQIYHAAGDVPGARRLLELLYQNGVRHRGVCRNLARVRMQMGEDDSARAVLSEIPSETWTPFEAEIDLQLCMRARDNDELERRLATHLERWPGAPLLLKVQAWVAEYVLGDFAEADRIRAVIRRTASDEADRSSAAADSYVRRVDALLGEFNQALASGDSTRVDALGPRVHDLEEEGRGLLEEVEYVAARGKIAWKLAVVADMSGDRPAAALGFFEIAVSATPDNAILRWQFLYGLMAWAGSGLGAEIPDGTEAYLRGRARDQLRALVRLLEEDRDFLDEQRPGCTLSVIENAEALSDWMTLERALEVRLRDVAVGSPEARAVERRLLEVRARRRAVEGRSSPTGR